MGSTLDDLAADDDGGEDEERVANEGDQVAGEMARDGENVRWVLAHRLVQANLDHEAYEQDGPQASADWNKILFSKI